MAVSLTQLVESHYPEEKEMLEALREFIRTVQ
jgi:hypothetical protein